MKKLSRQPPCIDGYPREHDTTDPGDRTLPMEGVIPPQDPPEIEQGLPKWWPRQGVPIPWPVDLRAYLVDTLRQEHQPATLMEAEPLLRTSSLDTGFFLEVQEKLPVGRFFAFWPRGANPAGLNWEFPLLVERAGTPAVNSDTVHIFPEEGVGDWDPETGLFEFTERGYRPTYQRDLSRCGFQIWKWADYATLVEKVRRAARYSPPKPT
jgi:hypothetical protein